MEKCGSFSVRGANRCGMIHPPVRIKSRPSARIALISPMFSHGEEADCLTLLKVTPVFDAEEIDWVNHNYHKIRHFHSMWSFLGFLEHLACLNLHSSTEKENCISFKTYRVLPH